jgi:hypothetical protein
MLLVLFVTTIIGGPTPEQPPTKSEFKEGFTQGYHKAMEDMEYMRQSSIHPIY